METYSFQHNKVADLLVYLIHLLTIYNRINVLCDARINVENILNWDFYWNKCTLYIKIQPLLKHYYMYSTLFIEITQSV
jgi:hypothetical protein